MDWVSGNKISKFEPSTRVTLYKPLLIIRIYHPLRKIFSRSPWKNIIYLRQFWSCLDHIAHNRSVSGSRKSQPDEASIID